MSLSGGGDRSELRPTQPDGTSSYDDGGDVVVGNHRGQYSGFCIVNPKPGTVHQFATHRDVLSARQRGWWIAREEDGTPAYARMALYQTDHATPLDTAGSPYPEYVHMVTTEENFGRLMAEREQLNREQLAPAGLGYLDNISSEEYDTGRTERGHLATRFATRDHGTFLMEGEKVVEHLTPNGILREEDL